MSKELEALENIKHYDTRVGLHEDDYKIIESALKTLEQLQVIIGAEKVEDLPKLALETENAFYSACHNLKKAEKKLKALEIIKKKPLVALVDYKYTYEEWLELIDERGKDLFKNKEEYDLLKEVLL